MNKCCKITFKRALEEVLLCIEANKPETVENIIDILKNCIFVLNKMEKKK